MKKILLIDDDRDFNESLMEYLEYEGFDVACAFDGKEGLSLVHQEKTDLIITDIVMPEADGIEFLRTLMDDSQTPSTKIIAMSGGGRIGGGRYLELAKAFGADHVFDKPLDVEAFMKAINKLLD